MRRLKTRDGSFSFSVECNLLVQRNICSDVNSVLVQNFYTSYIYLLADSPLTDTYGQKPTHVFRKFHQKLMNTHVSQIISQYASLMENLLFSIKDGDENSSFIDSFKDTPIFKEYLVWYRTRDTSVFRFIYTFLTFGKKIKIIDEELYPLAFRQWEEVERGLCDWKCPSWIDDITRIMRHIFSYVPYEIPFMGHHGSGSTSEGKRDIDDKNNLLYHHPRLHKGFFQNTFSCKSGEIFHDPNIVIPNNVTWNIRLHTPRSSEISRLKFVPKNYKSARTICMEPISFMFFQQAYRWELEDIIHNGIARFFIDLKNQKRNQLAALRGSETKSLDTIDLKAASDSVHIDLVKRIFPRRVVFKLLATRTSQVRVPDGSVVSVKKFAPMGSALCFPTQCLVFLSVVLYAYVKYVCEQHDMSFDEVLSNEYFFEAFLKKYVIHSHELQCPAIYGDDIVCDRNITANLVTYLSELGFTVNTDKSFTGNSPFRESCGKHYYNGIDVTPTYFAVPNYGTQVTIADVASIITHINNVGDVRSLHYRSYLISLIVHLSVNGTRLKVLFSSNRNEGLAIYSKNPHMKGYKRRYNEELQRQEVRSTGIADLKRKSKNLFLDEIYNYNMWWQARYDYGSSNISNVGHSHTLSYRVRPVWRWTPDW